VKCIIGRLNDVRGAVHERTVMSVGFLAQASTSRLGETNRGSLWFFCTSCRLSDESLFWVRHSLAQARRARLSERVQEAIVSLF